jgi:hypothetical protein
LDRNGDAAIRQNVLSPVFFSLLRLQEYLKPHFLLGVFPTTSRRGC